MYLQVAQGTDDINHAGKQGVSRGHSPDRLAMAWYGAGGPFFGRANHHLERLGHANTATTPSPPDAG